jgi:dienelactone hydrolase
MIVPTGIVLIGRRFFPQTQQGADIIASALCTKVYMPDFFEPDGAFDIRGFPPKSDEDRAAIQNFFATTAKPSVAIAKLKKLGEHIKAQNSAGRIGVYGFCWGKQILWY